MFGVRLTQLTAEERETQTNPAQPFGISGKLTPACKQTARKVAVRLTSVWAKSRSTFHCAAVG